MTNLLEKSLITGFGIFALILFLILIAPFFQEIEEYKEKSEKDDLDDYSNFVNKVNSAINYFINNHEEEYIEKIEYPDDINVTFTGNYAIFDFLIDGKVYSKTLKYDDQFIQKSYCDIPSKTYELIITLNSSLLSINFKNLD